MSACLALWCRFARLIETTAERHATRAGRRFALEEAGIPRQINPPSSFRRGARARGSESAVKTTPGYQPPHSRTEGSRPGNVPTNEGIGELPRSETQARWRPAGQAPRGATTAIQPLCGTRVGLSGPCPFVPPRITRIGFLSVRTCSTLRRVGRLGPRRPRQADEFPGRTMNTPRPVPWARP